MAKLFLNQNISSVLSSADDTENFQLPKYINIVDNSNKHFQRGGSSKDNFSITSSEFMGQTGGNGSITSEDLALTTTTISLRGGAAGALSVTSAAGSDMNQVDKLVSMLTSESDGLSQTNTEDLENQLKNVLSKKSVEPSQNGGASLNAKQVRDFFSTLSRQGVDVDVRLNSQSLSNYFGLTEGEEDMYGGKSKRGMEGGNNPGFKAFLALKKYISEKLSISNGPKAAKVAGAVQREAKEKNPSITDGVKISEKAQELFDGNMDKYKKMLD